MRVEATIPETRGVAMSELADELGMSRSQVVDEALALFIKAVLEIRKGRRLVTIHPGRDEPACEIVTPALSALEWTMNRQTLVLSDDERAKMAEIMANPPPANAALEAAMKRHRR